MLNTHLYIGRHENVLFILIITTLKFCIRGNVLNTACVVLFLQSQCCLQLIRLGANVNAANQVGQTPLLLASAAEYDDIIKLLLK